MSQQKPHIALITTWFPPENGVAVNRMSAFAKYLSTDFDVSVFTLGDTEREDTFETCKVYYFPSTSILEKFKHKTTDGWFRHNFISVINIFSAFFGISKLKKWQKNVLNKMISIQKTNKFDLILSSYSPIEPHLVAMSFLDKNSNVPWIADMRDEMSCNPFIGSKEKNRFIELEQKINKKANAVLSVSQPIVDDFKKLMPDVNYFEEIRNGFDHDFRLENSNQEKNATFNIGYFGSFYGIRKPDTFFEALKNLLAKENLPISVKIVGAHANFSIPNAIKEHVQLLPELKYKDAIESMSKMDINLLIHPETIQKGVYTGKLFDYISVQKPVLGIVDKNDVAAKLLNDFDCGYIADFKNITEIENCILVAYNDWKNNTQRVASQANIQTLHRKEQVEKLKKIIHQLIKE